MEPSKLLPVLVLMIYSVSSFENCKFPAIYNFGDSNSDTGARSAAISPVKSPYGETFFGRPSGRFSDGRLILDFLAERLKLPYLSAYLDSIGTNFRHGANFATGGSSIRPGGYSPFHLGIQISQFLQFKARSTALYNELNSTRNCSHFKNKLPWPVDFARALYTIDIGQNDLDYGLQHTTPEQMIMSIPDILNQFSEAMQQLYQQGARFFWVHNTGPVGCAPYNVIYYAKPGNTDRNGCLKAYNDVAKAFNRQLQKRVSRLQTQLPDSVFTYVDIYSVKYQLISNAKGLGFVDPMEFCCGSYYGYHIDCGETARVNGTVYGNRCKYPSRHISWGGRHYSEAANLFVANQILNGSHSYPAFSIE